MTSPASVVSPQTSALKSRTESVTIATKYSVQTHRAVSKHNTAINGELKAGEYVRQHPDLTACLSQRHTRVHTWLCITWLYKSTIWCKEEFILVINFTQISVHIKKLFFNEYLCTQAGEETVKHFTYCHTHHTLRCLLHGRWLIYSLTSSWTSEALQSLSVAFISGNLQVET